jgi:RHS repeat-associated protein
MRYRCTTADPLDGDKLSELRFKAWGETRYSLTNAPTDRRFTGQIEEAGIGLYFYNARWYDSYLNRWTSPDSIIPLESQGVQAWDRYAFVNNNPVRFNDPLGHCIGPLAIVCVALIEAAPAIIEAVAYAVTAYVIADQISSNPPTVNGEQVNIGIIIPPGPGLIPEIPAISNPVPDRLARVIPAKYANTAETLGPPGVDDVFVTAADDIAGITSSQELAKRLALLDNSGNPLQGPLAILEFDTPSEGIASPILRNNPGFVGGGRTAGGAREFVIPNSRLEDLENLFIRSVK